MVTTWRSSIVRVILVSTVLTLAVDLFFNPTVHLGLVDTLGVTFLIQIIGVGLAAALVEGLKTRTLVRTLLNSLLFAFFLVFVLNPVNDIGLGWTFVSIFVIELAGFTAAEILTRHKSRR